MKTISILLADNHPEVLEATSEYLEEQGFRVLQASSPDEARKCIETEHIHLAVLDLRLSDDIDDLDKSGLRVAQSIAPSLPKIIWTRFTTDFRVVVEALRTETGHPPAVDFVDKLEGADALLAAIQRALSKYVLINRNLEIQWETALSFSQLVMIVNPVSAELQINRAAEFKDLFGKLFFTSTQITTGQILTRDRERIILPVYAYDESGLERQYLVSCGCRTAVLHENAQCEKTIPQKVSILTVGERKLVETVHFAAIAYPFMGEALEETISFRLYYQNRSAGQVADLVRRLYSDNLGRWYERGLAQGNPQPLYNFYEQWLGLSETVSDQQIWQKKLQGICQKALATGLAQIDYSARQLTIHQQGTEIINYPNPIAFWTQHKQVRVDNVLWGITHGNVTIDTILVDRQNKTWLIDFAHVAHAPLLRDFVMLETSVKLDLLKTTDCQQHLDLEVALLAMGTLPEVLDRQAISSEMADIAHVVTTIRQSATHLAGCDWRAYLGGLFFCMWQRIAQFELEKLYTRRALAPFVHALLATAVLANELVDTPQLDLPEAATQSLWLDTTNQQVWVEGQRVELTSQELQILTYLYNHANQVCTRNDILKEGFDGNELVDEDYPNLEEGRLNSAISRLRLKIDQETNKKKYLLTVRGLGYKLEI